MFALSVLSILAFVSGFVYTVSEQPTAGAIYWCTGALILVVRIVLAHNETDGS